MWLSESQCLYIIAKFYCYTLTLFYALSSCYDAAYAASRCTYTLSKPQVGGSCNTYNGRMESLITTDNQDKNSTATKEYPLLRINRDIRRLTIIIFTTKL